MAICALASAASAENAAAPAPGTSAPAPAAAVSTLDLSKPLTIDDALEVAFKNNPGIRIALDVARRSRNVVAESRANFNPRINATVIYTRQPEQTVSVPTAPGEPPGSFVVQNAENTMAQANVAVPIDINRQLAYALGISERGFQIRYYNVVAAAEQLIFSVKAAYYDLLRACGQQDVAQSAVNDAEVQLKDARAKFEAGAVARFDVTRAEVSVANLNQALIASRGRVELARSAFNRVLGIDINSPTTIVGVAVSPDVTTVDVPKEVDTAYANRPDVRAAEVSIELNQTNVKLQRTGYLPSLSVVGVTTYNLNTSTFQTNNLNWAATVNVSIPIWEGGITRARVEQAKADVQNAVDTLDDVKLGAALEVRTAAVNLQEAAERMKSTAENVALAEESLRLANVRYTAGISTLVEVIDAENALTLARFNYVQAEYDYATALADLQRATAMQPEMSRVQILDAESIRLAGSGETVK